ncbi:hypothetical protein RJ55_01929 [Drechmeria coniospora]|nr:hypothetical protein RJ55_01929 [Drechmeria coniospora]
MSEIAAASTRPTLETSSGAASAKRRETSFGEVVAVETPGAIVGKVSNVFGGDDGGGTNSTGSRSKSVGGGIEHNSSLSSLPNNASSSKSPIALSPRTIIGISVGVVVTVIVMMILVWMRRKRRNKGEWARCSGRLQKQRGNEERDFNRLGLANGESAAAAGLHVVASERTRGRLWMPQGAGAVDSFGAGMDGAHARFLETAASPRRGGDAGGRDERDGRSEEASNPDDGPGRTLDSFAGFGEFEPRHERHATATSRPAHPLAAPKASYTLSLLCHDDFDGQESPTEHAVALFAARRESPLEMVGNAQHGTYSAVERRQSVHGETLEGNHRRVDGVGGKFNDADATTRFGKLDIQCRLKAD